MKAMRSVANLKKKYAPLFPSGDLDLLLSHALRCQRARLYSYPEYRPSVPERLRLAYYLCRRRRGYPIAFITHNKEFYGLDFYVNKHTLIPRPETELIVEETISNIQYLISNKIPNDKNNKLMLIDVGTGSGCIPIAILKSLKQFNNLTIQPFAVDISRPALRVARKNAQRHNVKINFLRGNLLQPIVNNSSFFIHHSEKERGSLGTLRSSFIITANLPYLTQEQFASEPSIQREPRSALIAANNGLALYEQLLQQIQSLFFIHHSSFFILLEIDPSQTDKISSLITHYLPTAAIKIKSDLAGRDRMVVIKQFNNLAI